MKLYIQYDNSAGGSGTAGPYTKWEDAEREYLRLQGIYPSTQLALYNENDYGEQTLLHRGYWQPKQPSTTALPRINP